MGVELINFVVIGNYSEFQLISHIGPLVTFVSTSNFQMKMWFRNTKTSLASKHKHNMVLFGVTNGLFD